MKKAKNLVGIRFGNLVVEERITNQGKHLKWKCRCDCGNITYVLSTNLYRKHTTSCGCLKNRKNRKNPKYTGFEDITGTFLCRWKTGAKQRNLEISISNEYMWDLFIKQNRKCALTGLPIKFEKSTYDTTTRTASLDRKNPKFGYVEGNVQWVHKIVNFIKQNLNDEEFLCICKLIIDYHKGDINVETDFINSMLINFQSTLCKSR